jgi:hypothetical protein
MSQPPVRPAAGPPVTAAIHPIHGPSGTRLPAPAAVPTSVTN